MSKNKTKIRNDAAVFATRYWDSMYALLEIPVKLANQVVRVNTSTGVSVFGKHAQEQASRLLSSYRSMLGTLDERRRHQLLVTVHAHAVELSECITEVAATNDPVAVDKEYEATYDALGI